VNDEFDDVLLPSLPSSLAWELTYNATSILLTIVESMIPGDYNGDGTVDAADYVVWRNGLGTTYTHNDYNTWRANFGQTVGGEAVATLGLPNLAVPEPTSRALYFFAAVAVFAIPRGCRRHSTRLVRSAGDALAPRGCVVISITCVSRMCHQTNL
jgi:hypothetical protein